VHKTWFFGDPELFKELEQVRNDKAALRKEMDAAVEEFGKAHGAEMQALEKSHSAEMEEAAKRAQALFQQGKYEEGKAVLEKIKPFHYEPVDSWSAPYEKRQKDLDQREQELLARRRSVSFRIYTNRTPSTTAYAYPAKPIGTLAGRTLYLQDRGTMNLTPGHTMAAADLAIFLGPANFHNPRVKLSETDPKVKCIVVWAWIESLPDTLGADEAAVKKVLEKIDYNGLSRLIEP
jgi:hypothetical protein